MPLGLGSDEAPRRQRRLRLPRQRPARDKGDSRDGIKGGQNGAITGQNGMWTRATSSAKQGKAREKHEMAFEQPGSEEEVVFITVKPISG